MSNKPVNPPAFPLHNHGAQTLGMHLAGMTLRDYFAAKAMQAYMSDTAIMWDGERYKSAANQAYRVADAMLEAREK